MAPNKSKTAKAKTVELDPPSSDEASDVEFEGFNNDVEMEEKDDDELELERAVFGDSAGFRENLGAFTGTTLIDRELEEEGVGYDGEDGGLEGIDDQDLFFTDTGATPGQSQALIPVAGEDESEDDIRHGREPAAWEDSDDERITVSLASVPRLRKLRKTEEEDVISGKEYVKRLREQFERLYPVPDWAKDANSASKKRRRPSENADDGLEYGSEDDMDVDEDELSVQPLAKLLQGADSLIRGRESGPNKRRKLRPEVLDIQRMKDIPGTQPSAVTSLMFHPTLPLLLSSGPSSTLYLHHIQPLPPHPNPLLTSMHIKGVALSTTAFHPNPRDSRIFLSARRRYFHIWNLEEGTVEKVTRVYGHQHEQRSMERFSLSPDGKYMALLGTERKGGGVINFLDASTLQWVAQARIEAHGGIADFAWWGDSKGVCIVGKTGEVTEWNIGKQRPLARWQDEGAVGTTTIALGGKSGREGWMGGDRWIAIGSSSGIVNVYDRREWAEVLPKKIPSADENSGVPTHPKPTRVLDQLVHPTSHLAFSPDGQILVMASRWKKDALRLVHLPSCTVYRNWPTSSTPLGRITAVAWGKGDGESAQLQLAVANEAGKIRLWEIRG